MGEKHSRNDAHGTGDGSDLIDRALVALRRVSGGDFADFRATTLQRRISRRMGMLGIRDLEEYVARLECDDVEVRALFGDILISVTGFFREPRSFETLQRSAFPQIISRNEPDGIRLWVPGCSTGEEPYSLAIALREALELAGVERQVQIFATDINDAQIARARAATYSHESVASLTPERLAHNFERVPTGWRLRKHVREMCVFARHDITRDPPFTRIDLVSCRNLLIYWNRKQQDRVLPLIHYALRPSGFLFLGSSESAGRFPEQFELVDRTSRLYRRLDTQPVARVRFRPYHPGQLAPPPRPPVALGMLGGDVIRDAEKVIAREEPKAALLVNEHLEGAYFWGATSAFFAPSPGDASLSLVRLVARGLLPDAMSAVEEVRASRTSTWRGPLATESGDPVYLHVEPVRNGAGSPAFLILVGDRRVENELTIEAPVAGEERELEDTREQLAIKVEELTATNEELRTAEDKLHETNRELLDANREQEMQNTRLRAVSDDLANVLSSSSMPMVVLDAEGRIRRITPPAAELLGVRLEDVGRPTAELAFTKEIPDLGPLVEKVAADHEAREHYHVGPTGRPYVLRVSPYVSGGQADGGVVLTFVDVAHAHRRAIEESSKLMSALAAINATINSLVDSDEIMRNVVNEAARAISAESAVLYLRDGEEWTRAYDAGLDDEEAGAVLHDGDLPFLVDVRRPQPWSVVDSQGDERFAKSVQRDAGSRGMLAVQLVARDTVVGSLVFGFSSRKRFTRAKLDFVGKLGTAASIALDNARLYRAQRNVADRLQEALLQMPEHVAGIEYAALYRAAAEEARVGGDFYDLFETGDHRVAIVIGDVSGKGLHAASLTALAKNAMRAHAIDNDDPGDVFTKTNRLVYRFTAADTFLTAFYAVLDTTTGELAYCAAGHPAPVLVHPEGAEFLREGGPILGAFGDLRYTTHRTVLGSRDSLLLYTDGIIEARDTDGLFGEDRLLSSAAAVARAKPKELIASVMDDTVTFAAGHFKDDVALLAIRLAADDSEVGQDPVREAASPGKKAVG